jgi:nuclear pore complex protein Nup85
MEWLNIHFIEPSTEEGDHLSGLDQPWQDESFWTYLTRLVRLPVFWRPYLPIFRATLRGLTKASVFFLDVLSRHPSEDLQALAPTLILLLNDQPRLANFSAERDFAFASRRWRDKIKALRIEMDQIPELDRYDGFDNWWDRLGDIIGILEGRGEVIKRICEDLGADWKEVCAAWGVFVETRLRRQDLS